jgi:hypothetical protein
MQLDRKSFATCKQWLFDFIGCASDIQATALAVGFWYIWEARHESWNEDVKKNPSHTRGKVVDYVDLIRTHLSKPVSKQRCEPSSYRWTPPLQGTVLVNSDAAISKVTCCMGSGVVIRNHHGVFLVAFWDHLNWLSEPEYAKALALPHDVILAKEEGFDRVVFASDCLSLVQRLSSSTKHRPYVGILVADIKVLVQHFSSPSLCHVKRFLNEAAHILAKSSLLADFTCVFHSDSIRRTLYTFVG